MELVRVDRQRSEALINIVSALYGKLLVVFGVALAITEAIADHNHTIRYDAFYLYLYVGSIAYLFYVYVAHLKERTVRRAKERATRDSPAERQHGAAVAGQRGDPEVRYGSFYLRVGVAAFGFGSALYSALALGRYFERSAAEGCADVTVAVNPVARTAFVILQMAFVFANNGKGQNLMCILGFSTHVRRALQFLASPAHAAVSRFGLAHMIAANLCKWLYVVVQEARVDISGGEEARNASLQETQSPRGGDPCWTSRAVASAMRDAAPYLFPCTVEYSLLCSVILAAMWRSVRDASCDPGRRARKRSSGVNVIYARSVSQFSVDLSRAGKGLFLGLVAAAASALSLLVFAELEAGAAVRQADACEAALYASAAAASVCGLVAVRSLPRRPDRRRLQLEHALLFAAHGGLLLYLVFLMAGGFFDADVAADPWRVMKVLTPASALVQSCCQTLLVVDAWRRACSTPDQLRRKPGRQHVTFLLVANVCMWAVNRLLNNRPWSHPAMARFYGARAWTIITHVCVPLVMCYRFQSSVCLYEIWMHVYKMQ
ncbi:proton channel OtopLc-like [Bacillus rossius redtenbacheri]|uniref:proton channel OtopLc-like n=1 Tax=Bacillus rossius redtenbacheri TaxID=93214 RepID=UPI002FDC89F2